MYEPRLFETYGPVEVVTTTLTLGTQGWRLTLTTRREGGSSWTTEHYEDLSWGEVLDVLTAAALA